MRMCACLHVFMSVCLCVSRREHVCLWVHLCVYVCMSICVRVCVCAEAPVGSRNTRCLCSVAPHMTSAHVCFPGNIRISDLGLAVELKEGQTKTKGYAGTPGKSLRARVGAESLERRGEALGVPMAWGRWHSEGWGFVWQWLPHPQSKE